MMLCDLCQPITVAELHDNVYEHQRSLAALKASAESGCHLCKLLWTCLVTQCHPKAIAFQLSGRLYGHEGITDTAIRLRGEFHDIGFAEDNIRVHSGPSALDNAMTTGTFLPQTDIWGNPRVYAPLGKNSPIAWCSIAVMLRWVLAGGIKLPLNQPMFLECLNVHRHVC